MPWKMYILIRHIEKIPKEKVELKNLIFFENKHKK